MSKENSRNPFHILKKKSPRIWAVVVFPILVIVTLFLVPLIYAYVLMVDIPIVVKNLWEDVKLMFRVQNNDVKRRLLPVWKDLYKSFVVNKDMDCDNGTEI